MRKGLVVVASAASLLACSSPDPTPSARSGPMNEPIATAAESQTVAYFDGTFDPVRNEVQVTYRTPDQATVTLPGGGGSDEVYFHTNSVAYTGGALTGSVDGVNGYPGALLSLRAVIDSVSSTQVTNPGSFFQGTANGALGSGSANHTDAVTWSFSDPSGTAFSFKGHATAIAPLATGIGIISATFGHNNTPICTSSCNVIPIGGPTGSNNYDTTTLAEACNGSSSCTWPAGGETVAAALPNDGDPSNCCYKDFEVNWVCSGSGLHTLTVCGGPNSSCEGASQTNLVLTCP